MLEILNLGAGVQSSTLLLLSIRGELPRFSAAIFADTGWEPRRVYTNLDWLTQRAAGAGIPVFRVSVGRNIRDDGTRTDGRRFATMPLYTVSDSGHKGLLRRQCTREFKVEPVERFIRRTLLSLKPRQRMPLATVRQWFGISADEADRMRTPRRRWQKFVYPLCGVPDSYLERAWTRLMCADWLRAEYPGRDFPRSACIGCPFRSNAEWREMKKGSPDEYADAVGFDEQIRDHRGYKGMESVQYIHTSCTPLGRANLDEEQMQMEWGNECAGMCGV